MFPIDSGFKVQVVAGAVAGGTDFPYLIAGFYLLSSGLHGDSAHMPVETRETVAMVDDDHIAISVIPTGEYHLAVGSSNNLGPLRRRQVDARMPLLDLQHWVQPLGVLRRNPGMTR